MRRGVIAAILALLVSTLLAGCGGGGSTTCDAFIKMNLAQREKVIRQWRPEARPAGMARLVLSDCTSMGNVGGKAIKDLDDNFINHY